MKLNRIKSILVEKDYSQTQLAKELGKSFSVFADGQRLSCNRSLLALLEDWTEHLEIDKR